jgi:hypothetical protein
MSARVHGGTTQKTPVFIPVAVGTSDVTRITASFETFR